MRTAVASPPPVAAAAAAGPFEYVPDPIPSLIVCYLDSQSRKQVAYAVPKITAFRQAVRERIRICIPPDAARRDPLLQRLTGVSSSSSWMTTKFSRFGVVNHHLLEHLTPIANQVQDLSFTRFYPCQRQAVIDMTMWPRMQAFPQLVRLSIHAAFMVDQIDLRMLSQTLPKLQKLLIRDCYYVYQMLQPMQDLHTLKLINTNIRSFRIAVGLPKLSYLSLFTRDSSVYYLTHTASLADEVAPLRVLRTSAWEQRVTSVFGRHAKTLEVLHVNGPPHATSCIVRLVIPLLVFPALTSLYVGDFEQLDLGPLTILVSLEELTIKMAPNATSCQPLQKLRKLRRLKITNGWLRDIVGNLDRLQQLEAIDTCAGRPHQRAVLGKPRNPRQTNTDTALRDLSLTGGFKIVVDEDLMPRLQRLEQVRIFTFAELVQGLPMIQQLPRLKRILIDPSDTAGFDQARDTPLASVRCLEEVSMPQWMVPAIPKWFVDATNLRKLHLDRNTTSIENCPPNITHLYASMAEDAKIVDKICAQRLIHLRVVSIPKEVGCLVLRHERYEGGALPLLRFIFHSDVDCLSVSSSLTQPHEPLRKGVMFSSTE